MLFGVGGVLGQFYIEYGKLVETLFNVRHMGLSHYKDATDRQYENNLIMFQSLIVSSSIIINNEL